jgi:hypothetical protein
LKLYEEGESDKRTESTQENKSTSEDSIMTENKTEEVDDYLNREDIAGIISRHDSSAAAAQEVLSHKAFFWDQNRKAVWQGNGVWGIVNQKNETKQKLFFDSQMASNMLRVVYEHDNFEPEETHSLDQKSAELANDFIDGVTDTVDKLIKAAPDDESTTDEKELRLSYEKLKNYLNKPGGSVSEDFLQRYRDRFVQTMNYFRNHKRETWNHANEALQEEQDIAINEKVKKTINRVDNLMQQLQ